MKDIIRNQMRARRRALSAEEIQVKSAAIHSALFSLDVFKKADTVMVYVSAFKEVDTHTIINYLAENGKKTVVPISNTADHTITPSYIDGLHSLKRGAYGILEPKEIKYANHFDVILVPGVAFDEKCSRCGFGAGYYDRLLSKCCAVKIGLCYDFQIVKNLETDIHDIPMDIVISERRIIYAV